MHIYELIKKYDYKKWIEDNRKEFILNSKVRSYLDNESEENFRSFARDFLKNNYENPQKLLSMHKIPSSFDWKKIIQCYGDGLYVYILKLYYNEYWTIEDIRIDTGIPKEYLREIIKSIKFYDNKYCPNCGENNMDIIVSGKTSDENYRIRCNYCKGSAWKYTELLSEDERDEMIRNQIQENFKLETEAKYCAELLKEQGIRCPDCNNELNMKILPKKKIFMVSCEKCKYQEENIMKTINNYRVKNLLDEKIILN